MRKIVASLFMTLDGVVDAPERWRFPYANEEMHNAIESQMAAEDTILLGRATYETFAGTWPDSDSPFAEHMNETPKLVISMSLDTVEWQNSTLLDGELVDEIWKLKRRPGKNIGITGSTTLVQSLLRRALVDELRLLVHPLVVGHGRRLFEHDRDRCALSLVASEPFSTGVLSVTYRPLASAGNEFSDPGRS